MEVRVSENLARCRVDNVLITSVHSEVQCQSTTNVAAFEFNIGLRKFLFFPAEMRLALYKIAYFTSPQIFSEWKPVVGTQQDPFL